MDEAKLNELSKRIIGGAFQLMNVLGVGFLEPVYVNALAHELRKNGLKAEAHVPIEVRYDYVRAGIFEAGYGREHDYRRNSPRQLPRRTPRCDGLESPQGNGKVPLSVA